MYSITKILYTRGDVMRWRVKRLNYNILVPNFGKHIYNFNESEAATYFEWYMNKLPERVEYVSRVCATETGISQEKMNLTPESLTILWKWFRRRAKLEPIVVATEDNRTKRSAVWMGKKQLTLETEYIIRDIGMYLGETFRKNNARIYWTYYTKPRRDFFVNYPLLKGFIDRSFGQPFEASFEPIHMVRVQAAKIIDKTSKVQDLEDLYNLWVQKV